jgi:hypothetical protein
MTAVPDNALAVAGFTLAHATWSISDLPDDELLVPMAIVERGEERELMRFEAETQADAISEGKRVMVEGNDAKAWAFAREGALRLQEGGDQQDALVVDFWAEGMEHPLTLVQCFERFTKDRGFRLVGDMIISSGGKVLDLTSAEKVIAGINEGIQEHPTVAELWPTWL